MNHQRLEQSSNSTIEEIEAALEAQLAEQRSPSKASGILLEELISLPTYAQSR